MGFCTTIGYDATMDLQNVEITSVRSDNAAITVMDASEKQIPMEITVDPEQWG